MIDQEHRDLYMFATAPCCTGGAIYYKKTSLSNVSFSGGVGTPFIQSPTDTNINDATSTKQNLSSATGLMVMASSDVVGTVGPEAATTGITSWIWTVRTPSRPRSAVIAPADGATGVTATSNGEVTFSEAMDSSTINGSTFTLVKQGTSQPVAAQVTYDRRPKKATLDPDADLDPSATYTAAVKGGTSGVKDPRGQPACSGYNLVLHHRSHRRRPPLQDLGLDTPRRRRPPEYDSGPSGTLQAAARAASPSPPTRRVAPSSISWTTEHLRSCSSPQAYDGLSNGTHTFEVRATDAAGNSDATPASRTWTVDTTAPVVESVAPADGAMNVAVANNIEATFSEAMDASTLTTSTFTLLKQDSTTTPVEAAVSYDSANKRATSGSGLRPGGKYFLHS